MSGRWLEVAMPWMILFWRRNRRSWTAPFGDPVFQVDVVRLTGEHVATMRGRKTEREFETIKERKWPQRRSQRN